MSKAKLIAVSPQNWESLRKFGEYGDSMNTIVSKILARIDTLPSQNQMELMEKESKNCCGLPQPQQAGRYQHPKEADI
jgi:hypothetical protein